MGGPTRRQTRPFGSVRQLSSGKFQVRYTLDGVSRTGKDTFLTRGEARVYLNTVQTDLLRGTLTGSPVARETVAEYGARWIAQRHGLKISTRSQYGNAFRLHIAPHLGHYRVDKLTPDMVRRWQHDLRQSQAVKRATESPGASRATSRNGSATSARAYRLLSAIFSTAVEDSVVPSSPCRIKGGGKHKATERPIMTVSEVEALADAVPKRYRALVLVLGWTGLRVGEAAALARTDFDLEGERPIVRVSRRAYIVNKVVDYDTPKSAAGVRSVALPPHIVPELRTHIDQFVARDDLAALVFTSEHGASILGAYSRPMRKAFDSIGRNDMRVHDLRHTGQVLAAEAGASMAELMRRMGHSTTDAAQVYMHATEDHGRAIAERLSAKHDANVIALSRNSITG